MQNNNQSPKPNNRHKNPPKTKRFRSELRKRLTPAEATLWKTIKNGQVDGLMFRRQFGVDMYILDFYCPEIKLAIELDGQSHEGKENYDQERIDYLKAHYDIHVIRFENYWVFRNIEVIIGEVLRYRERGNLGTDF